MVRGREICLLTRMIFIWEGKERRSLSERVAPAYLRRGTQAEGLLLWFQTTKVVRSCDHQKSAVKLMIVWRVASGQDPYYNLNMDISQHAVQDNFSSTAGCALLTLD